MIDLVKDYLKFFLSSFVKQFTKTIIYILIIVIFLFIFSHVASASTIDLTVVPSTYGEYTNVGVTGTPVTTPNWPAINSTLHNGYYLSQSILSANYGYEVFDFGNIALCNEGQGLIISGTITTQNYTKITQNPFSKVEAYIHDELVTCSFNVIDSTTIRYSCLGKGGGNLRFVVNYQMQGNDFMGFGSTSNALAISKQVNVTCDASNNDIINNQNQNTQDIINNQNQNAQQASEERQGIWDTLTSGISSIGNWFNNLGSSITNGLTILGNFIIDGIKGLLVPTDEQIYEIIEDSQEMSEIFGFIFQ